MASFGHVSCFDITSFDDPMREVFTTPSPRLCLQAMPFYGVRGSSDFDETFSLWAPSHPETRKLDTERCRSALID